ncbi:hypothetical protein CsSME_00033045 [Camellia sinensis var. sinensis]
MVNDLKEIGRASEVKAREEEEEEERIHRKFKEEFSEVEDVVIKSLKKRGSAVVVMASKDAVAAAATTAAGSVFGNLSNPLWVFPLQPISTSVPGTQRSDLVGDAHQVFEDLVLKKLQKVIA